MIVAHSRAFARTLALTFVLASVPPGGQAQPAVAASGAEPAPTAAQPDRLLPTSIPAPIYVCPMHPQIVRNQPGHCPICGMALVGRDPAGAVDDGHAPAVEVDGRMRQALAVRTAAAELRKLSAVARVPARVEVDPNRIAHVHTRVRGWVESLHVHAVGEAVEADQVLLEIYAPDLSAAQEDYLIALRQGGRESRAERAAAVRLRALGVDDRFIDALAERGTSLLRVPLRAPRAGVVTSLNVRHGMYVDPSTDVVEITGLDEIWIRADLFPEQLDRLGNEIFGAFRMAGVPDRTWRGRAAYVYPDMNEPTQTVQVRFPVPNLAGHLRIGAFMEGRLRGVARDPVLTVPFEAVIRTADGERVVVEEGDGRFRPVAVHTGHSADGFTAILHGLEEGQRVVVNAQFLLDAESALRAGLDRLGGGGDHAH